MKFDLLIEYNRNIFLEKLYLEYSEPFHNCIPAHIQNPVIYMKIGKPCLTLEIENPDIWATLKYSEP